MRISTEPRSPAYVSLGARPLRIGVLVPEIPQLPWQAAFAGALASQVRIWGGIANLLVPLREGLADSDLFWALVELWDPDWYAIYAGAFRTRARYQGLRRSPPDGSETFSMQELTALLRLARALRSRPLQPVLIALNVEDTLASESSWPRPASTP